MSKDELISKQQLELEDLKEQLRENKETLEELHGKFYNIGAPLNDNILKFNDKQLSWCGSVYLLIKRLY